MSAISRAFVRLSSDDGIGKAVAAATRAARIISFIVSALIRSRFCWRLAGLSLLQGSACSWLLDGPLLYQNWGGVCCLHLVPGKSRRAAVFVQARILLGVLLILCMTVILYYCVVTNEIF